MRRRLLQIALGIVAAIVVTLSPLGRCFRRRRSGQHGTAGFRSHSYRCSLGRMIVAPDPAWFL